MLPLMIEKTGLGDHLRALREAKKLSRPALAQKAGIHPNTVQKLETEEREITWTWIEKLGPHLDVTPAQFFSSSRPAGAPAAVKQPGFRDEARRPYQAEPSALNLKIPIMGTAEGGEDGFEHWNGEVVGFADRPPNMVGVVNAYAVYVVSDSMEPRYYAGETLFVNPARPVTPGSHVLVQLRPLHEGDTPRAVVKKLVRVSGSKITLEQYNPRKTFELQRKDIVSIHRIMASGES